MRPALLTVLAALGLTVIAFGQVQEQPPARIDVEPLLTPYDAVRFAWADAKAIAAVDPARATQARYLAIQHMPRARRLEYWQSSSFLSNSLSREKLIVRPGIVPDSDLSVFRIFLSDYKIDPAAWDRFVEHGSGPADKRVGEPYFYATYKDEREVDDYKDVEYGHYYDEHGRITDRTTDPHTGKPYRFQYVKTVREKAKKKTTKSYRGYPKNLLKPDNGAAVASLTELTGTDNPIVRADWFLAFASIAPAYYDLLGFGNTIQDIDKLFGLDVKLIEKLRSDLKDTQIFSGVALNNRTLNRYPLQTQPIGAYKWQSHDSLKSVDDRDYLTNLVNEKFDATEDIWTLFNGLQAYALGDGKGKRLDVADPNAAQDRETALHDKQIYAGRNCMSCHARGIRPIEAEVRQLSRGQIGAVVTDPKLAERVFDLYFSYDLDPIITHDMAVFEAAVRQCNDLAPLANGRQFERLIVQYFDAPLTAREIAAEAGVSEPALIATLARAVNIPPQYTGLLQQPPRPVRRDQHEKGFPILQEILVTAP